MFQKNLTAPLGFVGTGGVLQIYLDTLPGTVEQAARARYPGLSVGTDPIVAQGDAAALRQSLDDWQTCRAGYAKLVAQAGA